MNENNLIAIIKDYLEGAGVQVSTDMISFEKEKNSYIKVEGEIVGQVDAIMQQLSQIMFNKVNTKDVYRVVYDKGLGVLQKSAQYPGQLLGNVVDPSSNNHIKDVARLQELAVGPQMVNGIFTAMSMVTGQYFMSQINSDLGKIEASICEIQKNLEDDKKSKLRSSEEFLKMTQNTIGFILDNEVQKQSTLSAIQKIRLESRAGIEFYRMQINDLKDISVNKDKPEEVINNMQKICFLISEYWYSLYLYCFSLYLEPVVAQNTDSSYLSMLENEMIQNCNCYKSDYVIWNKKLNEYIDTANAFEANKFLEGLSSIANSTQYIRRDWAVVGSLLGMVVGVIDSADKKNKEKKKKKAMDVLSQLGSVGKNMDAIEAKRSALLLYDTLNNRKLELVRDHKDVYIRVDRPQNN